MENIKFDYVIYHRGCFDGFTSFMSLLLAKKITKNAIVFPDVPFAKYAPREIEGKNVISMDVAYNPKIVEEISKKAKVFYFIDHHVTIFDSIKKLKLPAPHKIIYDVKKSGAGITWDYFNPTKARPLIIDLIEDHDIGRWEDNRSKPLNAYLEVNHYTIHNKEHINKWKVLFNDKKLLQSIKIGVNYMKYKNSMIDRYSGYHDHVVFTKSILDKLNIPPVNIALFNLSGPLVSLLGKHMMTKHKNTYDFIAFYSYDFSKKAMFFSLRSNGYDVGKIASNFNGGGHKYASGFSYNGSVSDLFEKILFKDTQQSILRL